MLLLSRSYIVSRINYNLSAAKTWFAITISVMAEEVFSDYKSLAFAGHSAKTQKNNSKKYQKSLP